MTRRIHKTTSTLLAAVLAVFFVLSTCMVSLAATSSREESRVLTVKQTVGNSELKSTSVAYVLTPQRDENPMPVDADGNTYRTFTLTGSDSETGTLTFTEPGLYEYTLVGTLSNSKATFTGSNFDMSDKTTTVSHVFGYKVVSATDGGLEVIPYTCDDADIEILSDGSGLLVKNYLNSETTTSTTKTTTKSTTKSSGITTTKSGGSSSGTKSSGSSGSSSSGTTSKGGKVNTGDESQPLLWLGITAFAGLGLIFIILAKRKKDEDDEQA